MKLYIPHGSDESNGGAPVVIDFFALYIPHGSDESALNAS